MKLIISPDTKRGNRIPPGQHIVDRWPVLHHGAIPEIILSKWRFNITGLVNEEVELSYKEFTALPRVEVFSDIHCVTRWTRLNNTWEGVSIKALIDLVNILPEAKHVMVQGAGGFTTNLRLDDFLDNDVLFALGHDGNQLTIEHGHPLRLVVPRLYFWKSAKWVTGVEFMERERPGFWEQKGYHIRGDPWKEERFANIF